MGLALAFSRSPLTRRFDFRNEYRVSPVCPVWIERETATHNVSEKSVELQFSLQVCVAQGSAAIRQFGPSVVLLHWSIDFGFFSRKLAEPHKNISGSSFSIFHVCQYRPTYGSATILICPSVLSCSFLYLDFPKTGQKQAVRVLPCTTWQCHVSPWSHIKKSWKWRKKTEEETLSCWYSSNFISSPTRSFLKLFVLIFIYFHLSRH